MKHFSKSPVNHGANYIVPVNKIDLTVDTKGSSNRSKYLTKLGLFSSTTSKNRSSSSGSNYASDFSNTCGEIEKQEIEEDEFLRYQQECMKLIKEKDNVANLEFKKKFNQIKPYCEN